MNINATVFVQALNFFIVYWMLRYFLFRPVITIIEREEVNENSLRDIIDQQRRSLEIQEKERERHWYVCQEYFALHQPSIYHKKLLFSETRENDVPSANLPEDGIAQIITHTSNALKEKIQHVH